MQWPVAAASKAADSKIRGRVRGVCGSNHCCCLHLSHIDVGGLVSVVVPPVHKPRSRGKPSKRGQIHTKGLLPFVFHQHVAMTLDLPLLLCGTPLMWPVTRDNIRVQPGVSQVYISCMSLIVSVHLSTVRDPLAYHLWGRCTSRGVCLPPRCL